MAIGLEIKKRKFLVPESDDSCDLWRTYFTKLKKEVGQENAKMIFLITWKQNGSTSCTTNADFNKFLKKNEIDVSSAYTRTIADVSAIGGNILGLGKNLTKVLSIGAPIAFGTVLIIILVILFNSTKKANVTDVATKLPMGKAAKLAGATKILKR